MAVLSCMPNGTLYIMPADRRERITEDHPLTAAAANVFHAVSGKTPPQSFEWAEYWCTLELMHWICISVIQSHFEICFLPRVSCFKPSLTNPDQWSPRDSEQRLITIMRLNWDCKKSGWLWFEDNREWDLMSQYVLWCHTFHKTDFVQ